MRVGLPLKKNVLTKTAKNILLLLVATAEAPETDAAIQKKNYGSGMTALAILNKEMKDIMKIGKSLE